MSFSKIGALKRIEAMIPSLKRELVFERVLKAGAQGVTVFESKGKDTGGKTTIREQRGTKKYISEHSRFYTITALVYDSKLKDVVSAIIDAVHTGSKEDGMIFISSIDEAISIGTKDNVREIPEEDVVSRDDMLQFAKMSNLEKKKWIINKASEVKKILRDKEGILVEEDVVSEADMLQFAKMSNSEKKEWIMKKAKQVA